jgi:enamine deaminase RidA (YjgF/YER057c/UK114 family)
MTRTVITTGTPWEAKVGYARAVRVDDTVYLSGTTATQPDGSVAAPGDAYAQTLAALHNVHHALGLAGANLKDVLRVRLYVTDISRWEEYGRAHNEVLGQYRPVCTMVEVSRLIHPDMLIEIEVEALVRTGGWRWVEG